MAAGRAGVWDALRHRTDVVLDVLPEPRWPEGTAFEAPSQLSAPWPHTASLGGATEVQVDLAEVGSGTLLDVRHRGLGEGPAWDEAIGGYFAAWLQALAALGVLVESGVDARPAEALRGRERYVASGEIPAAADAAWRSLTDRYVLERWSDGVLDGAETLEALEGRFLRLALPPRAAAADAPAHGVATPTELTVILRRTPRGTHVALAEYGVSGREPSTRWPPMFERLARFLG
ncbi:MAG: hypothetical protein ABSB58_10930 [Gemmatimonadales bacterium]